MSMPVISSVQILRASTTRVKRRRLTSDGVLDLNTRVDLDEVVPAHLVDQELGGTSIPVSDALRELDGIGEDGLADLLGEVSRGCDFDDLLVATLHGAVTLEEVDGVALGVSEELHLNVTRTLEEPLNEDGTVTEGGLSLGNGTLEGGLEIRLLTDDAHTASTTAHRGLDDHCSHLRV